MVTLKRAAAIAPAALGLALLSLTALTACRGDGPRRVEPAVPEPVVPSPVVEVRDAWARPTPAVASVGAVYLTLRAGTDDALVAVDVDPQIAASAEVHETVVNPDTGAHAMQEVPALQLPAGNDVTIETGRHHIMLVDLAAALEPGATFEITLRFEHADPATVTVEVDAG